MSRLGAMDAVHERRDQGPIGAALTVRCHAGDNLMLHKALSLAARAISGDEHPGRRQPGFLAVGHQR
jgi:hypothetical protein